jgi:hypothetical protein
MKLLEQSLNLQGNTYAFVHKQELLPHINSLPVEPSLPQRPMNHLKLTTTILTTVVARVSYYYPEVTESHSTNIPQKQKNR